MQVRLELTDPTRGSSEPDRCWTQTNIMEACPEVMTPLCVTTWERVSQFSSPKAWFDFGLLAKDEMDVTNDPNVLTNASFYGRQAINVDAVREVLARAPGASPDDFERDILGYVRADAPKIVQSKRRYPIIFAKMPRAILRQRREIQPLHDDMLAWWQREVLGERSTLTSRELLAEGDRRFQKSMHLHLYSRTNLLPAAQGPLTGMALEVGGHDLSGRLLGGLGATVETEISQDIFELSRGVIDEAEFIRRHGFHGPSEGNPVSRTWREDPAPIRALAKAYAQRPDSDAPRIREDAARRVHDEAVRELLGKLPAAKRPKARYLVKSLGTQVRYLGLGKASFLMGIDAIRAAARRLGAELVEQGVAGDPDDTFYLTFNELSGPVPDNFAEVVAFRRARREEYQKLELPISWIGMPEPSLIASREPEADVDVVTGVGGSRGVAEGRCRVVHDPVEADEMEAGEIMVCRFTDPSWAALFPLADAVVVDIGGPASHGAVVSRELGIPAVVGTGNGTRVLRTGDLVRVDGSAGTVTILKRAGG